jgi:hypothetical protein
VNDRQALRGPHGGTRLGVDWDLLTSVDSLTYSGRHVLDRNRGSPDSLHGSPEDGRAARLCFATSWGTRLADAAWACQSASSERLGYSDLAALDDQRVTGARHLFAKFALHGTVAAEQNASSDQLARPRPAGRQLHSGPQGMHTVTSADRFTRCALRTITPSHAVAAKRVTSCCGIRSRKRPSASSKASCPARKEDK